MYFFKITGNKYLIFAKYAKMYCDKIIKFIVQADSTMNR